MAEWRRHSMSSAPTLIIGGKGKAAAGDVDVELLVSLNAPIEPGLVESFLRCSDEALAEIQAWLIAAGPAELNGQ